MNRHSLLRTGVFLVAVFLLPFGCGTSEENTMVGSDFITNRDWATPRLDSAIVFIKDSFFEASVSSGSQHEVVVGSVRKFRFVGAVQFRGLPTEADSVRAAWVTLPLDTLVGSADVMVDRIKETWTEGGSTRELETTLDGFTISPTIDTRFDLPLDWVRDWIDSTGANQGIRLQFEESEGNLIRFRSKEGDPDSTLGVAMMYIALVDSTGTLDTVNVRPRRDRFYAFKDRDVVSYLDENDGADTLLIGMHSSLSNLAFLQLSVPDSLRDISVNRAELILPVRGFRLDEDDELTIEWRRVLGYETSRDSVTFESFSLASGTFGPADSTSVATISVTDAVLDFYELQDWDPVLLLRAAGSIGRNRSVTLLSTESGGDVPRIRLLYTPLRDEAGGSE
ncbi:MAG: hypothetical protein HKN20_13045 [Gemmatimonadetes bacterium]|nr:hypothetical protein [Gemmatimonadota bacterium]